MTPQLPYSWVCGVTPAESILGEVGAQLLLTLAQTTVVLTMVIYAYGRASYGSAFWITAMTVLQGLTGMSFGLVVSAVVRNEQEAVQGTLATFIPLMLLSGTLWPVEAMPSGLKQVAYCLPQTLAVESMRGLMARGWGIGHYWVYVGFGVTGAWTVAMLCLGTLLMKL